MDTTYLLDWANLLLRWAHVITAIAWIGSSFYFVFLDNSLTPPSAPDLRAKGVGGELWAVHGGGFYHPQKYLVAPKALPENLHWFYWESYSTWLTGFGLFTVLYLFNAGTFLVDRSVFDWSPAAAITAALGFLAAFWLVYDGICRAFGQRKNGDLIVGAGVFAFVVFASWLACQLFAGRAAFLLVGAMLATTMSGNVFFWIIPGQRKVIAQMKAGVAVDPVHGQRAKQRSVHNTYFTLPVLVAMLSNHYGWLHSDEQNWLVLVLLMLAGAGTACALAARHGRHADAAGPGDRAGAHAVVGVAQHRGAQRRRLAGAFCRTAGCARTALRDVPQRPARQQGHRAAHARADRPPRPGALPAGGGAQADADEQRHRHHRRRTHADPALVRRRCALALTDAQPRRTEPRTNRAKASPRETRSTAAEQVNDRRQQPKERCHE